MKLGTADLRVQLFICGFAASDLPPTSFMLPTLDGLYLKPGIKTTIEKIFQLELRKVII